VRIKARAVQLLALREHSRAELERKLRARMQPAPADDSGDAAAAGELEAGLNGPTPAQFDDALRAVLDELEKQGLLSDRRAANAVLQAKSARYGARRLKQLLQARSLGADLVAETLAKAKDSELERALDVWRRRFGKPPVDLKDRARQQRFLAGRGFEPAVIERVMKRSGAPPEPGDED
jgi:regulatory protein